MQIPVQVTFRDMDPSKAVEANVREKAGKLERHFERVISCRVVVEAPHRRQTKGKLYNVRIDIGVPGKEILVNHAGPNNHAHEDVYVAIRDAFNAAARQLEDHARKIRGEVKTHEAPPHGRVVRLFPYKGYGFIEMSDGREIYFHENSVVNGNFAQLEVDHEVRVVVVYDESAQGPQATTVSPIGKHHLIE
jgi:ribosomal subunit interface protein